MNQVFVYIDLEGRTVQVGRMWVHVREVAPLL